MIAELSDHFLLALWASVAVLAILIEIIGPSFVFLFVAIAAFIVAGLAAMGVPLLYQVFVFIVAVVVLPLTLRHRLLRRFTGRGVPSRAEDLTGRSAVVTETIDPTRASGRISANGQDWAARCESRLEVGALSRVIGVDGIVLIVEPIRDESTIHSS